MIHRSLGPGVACVAAFFVVLGGVSNAAACLTTTCAVKNPPSYCVKDVPSGCWLAGIPLQWREPCVSFSVDTRGIPPLGLDYAHTEELVASSFALWPTASCADGGFPSIAVQSAGPLNCTSMVEYNPEGPNANAVIFQTQHWSHDPVAIGVTTVSFDPDTGRIMDADIEVNLTTGGLDDLGVRFVVTHEAGHFFGLDHSMLDESVMHAQSDSTDFLAPPVLSPDDINGICLAYPTYRRVAACDFEPEHGYSSICGGDVVGGCSVARRTPASGVPDSVVGALLLGSFLVRKRNTGLRPRSRGARGTR